MGKNNRLASLGDSDLEQFKLNGLFWAVNGGFMIVSEKLFGLTDRLVSRFTTVQKTVQQYLTTSDLVINADLSVIIFL